LFLLPASIISLSLSYALTDNIALRSTLAFDTKNISNNNMASFGVPIYFQKMYSGIFIEPGFDTIAKFYTAGGYHWMWDSNFNLFAGIGWGNKSGVAFLQISYAFGN